MFKYSDAKVHIIIGMYKLKKESLQQQTCKLERFSGARNGTRTRTTAMVKGF